MKNIFKALTFKNSPSRGFTLHANPIHTGLLKGRYFYMDEMGIIRAKNDGPAGAEDEIVR